MQRVLLLYPKNDHLSTAMPPLGILTLTSVLRKEFDADVRVIDMMLDNAPSPFVTASTFQPDLIGISAISSQAPAVQLLADALKEQLPNTPIVVGGPIATVKSLDAFASKAVDYAVIGEGEATFAELFRCLINGKNPDNVPGLALRNEEGIYQTAVRPLIEDLDAIPFPAHDLADIDAYERQGVNRRRIFRCNRFFTVLSSRGCPYNCNFCFKQFGNRFRVRSPKNVLMEIDVLHQKHGIREIIFVDDIFNLHRNRAMAILNGLKERNYGLSLWFANGVRSDLIDKEFLDAMIGAGAYRLTVAVETGSPRLQKLTGKCLDLDKVSNVITLANERGLMTHGLFMMGHPTETHDELKQTFYFARKSKLHTASFFFIHPFPGTKLRKLVEESFGEDVSIHLPKSLYDPDVTKYSLAAVSSKQLQWALRLGVLRFYANPFRAWRILRDLPNRRQFIHLVRVFFTQYLIPVFPKLFSRNKPLY